MKKGVTLVLFLFLAVAVFVFQLRRMMVPNAEPMLVVLAALLSALLVLAVLWERLRR